MKRYAADVNEEMHSELQTAGEFCVSQGLIPRNTRYYIAKLGLQTLLRFCRDEALKLKEKGLAE